MVLSLLIKKSLGGTTPSLLKEVALSNIEQELRNLNTKKYFTFKNIPVKYLKISGNSC